MRVLIVEDEHRLAEALGQVLVRNNYSVDLSFDGNDGLYQALTGIYDVVILDIMLPGLDGLSVLQQMRQEHINTPVILLTAKGDIEDRVRGLDSGADDYLAKPFQASELLARLRALARRKGEVQVQGILAFGDLELNPHTLELWVGANSCQLTLKESQLLEILIKNPGHAISTTTILMKVWGYDTTAEDNHVHVYVSFLRKKLAQMDSKAKIKTMRGLGYLLVLDPERPASPALVAQASDQSMPPGSVLEMPWLQPTAQPTQNQEPPQC